jgi:hypothetical protein
MSEDWWSTPAGVQSVLREEIKIRESRIEELEAKLAECEARLEKAVGALEFYGTLIGEKHECPWHMLSDDFGEKARTTLAELKGQGDE